LFIHFAALKKREIAFKALFKPADAFLTVQRYSFFCNQPNLLSYFSGKFFIILA